MYDLKFVDRTDPIPHRSFRVQCDSFHMEQVTVKKGETLEKYSPSIAQSNFPFEADSKVEALKKDEQVLIVNMAGAPGYKYIVGRSMFLFIMNNEGTTIDKVVV